MTAPRTFFASFLLALALGLAAGCTHAQDSGAPANAAPALRLPALQDVALPVPRPVQAVNAALGYGRQRLALVLGVSRVGRHLAVDSAPRDIQALAAALRASGFVVMLREDIGAAALREALAEFRQRLQPGGMGFAYFTGLGAQVEGRNLLLTRDTPLDSPAAGLATQLKAGALPLQELVDALMGTADSPRLLVVDAAFKHPALAALPQAGLAEQRLPPGMMALFGQALGAQQEVPAVAPLADPAPTDPRAMAASDFARTLVGALARPRVSGAAALREARRVIFDATLGQTSPWVGGDTDTQDEFAELTLLDGLLPSTPQDYAREALKQAARVATRPDARVGQQALTEGLTQPAAPAPGNARIAVPEPPGNATSLGSALQGAGSVLGAAGTVAGVAATAGAAAAALEAAQATATLSAATATASAAGSVAGQAVALGARMGSGGAAAEQPARQLVQQAAAPSATPAPLAAAPAAATTGAAELPVGRVLAQVPRVPAPPAPAPPLPDARTKPGPEGGERPQYTPRVNAHGHAEGDTYTYQLRDTWKDEVLGSTTTAIEEVLDDGRLLANGQQLELDAQGRVTRQQTPEGGLSRFEPAQTLWWSKPKPGERRSARFVEKYQRPGGAQGEIEFKGSSKVGRLRRIETPAGEFEALPIETSGWSYETMRTGNLVSKQFSRTVWYSPQLGHPVAIDIEDADRLGRLLRRERVELLHAQQAPRATP